MQADDKQQTIAIFEKVERKRLTEETQQVIVLMLACYRKTPEIIKSVEERFKVKLERQNVLYYHPYHNDRLGKKWKDLFNATREKYLDSTSDIPIANLVCRLEHYQEMFEGANGPGIKLQILRQAAEDLGGVFTNKRTITLDPREALAKMLGCSANELPPSNPTRA